MATIKSYTDIEQSKKLAKILPLESADMRYGYTAPYDCSDRMYDGGYDEIPYSKDFLIKNPNYSANEYDAELPCWSLAALLSILHDYTLQTNIDGTVFVVCESKKPMVSDSYDNPVDACVAMIEKLKCCDYGYFTKFNCCNWRNSN